jgi:hypothetical protein
MPGHEWEFSWLITTNNYMKVLSGNVSYNYCHVVE